MKSIREKINKWLPKSKSAKLLEELDRLSNALEEANKGRSRLLVQSKSDQAVIERLTRQIVENVKERENLIVILRRVIENWNQLAEDMDRLTKIACYAELKKKNKEE